MHCHSWERSLKIRHMYFGGMLLMGSLDYSSFLERIAAKDSWTIVAFGLALELALELAFEHNFEVVIDNAVVRSQFGNRVRSPFVDLVRSPSLDELTFFMVVSPTAALTAI